ncbi:MAG: ABC transporter substrate-binding protein [Nitrospinota bacterium]
MLKRAGALWIAGALLLAGVPRAEAAPAPKKFAVGAVTNTGNIVNFAAVDKGFYAKHGIDAKIFAQDTGSALSKALDAGELDLSVAAMSNIPVALERGLNAKAIVGYFGAAYTRTVDDDMLAAAVRPDSGIHSVADLKGKKVGVTFGTSSDLYLVEVLKRAGIAPSAMERINVQPSNMTALFDAGKVDAMVMWEPYITHMLDKVKGSRELIRGGGYFCQCAAMHGFPAKLYADRDLTQRVVNAIAEAARWVRDPKNLDEIGQISARYVRGLDPELAKRTHKYHTFDPRLGKNTFKAFNQTVQQLLEQKKMKAPYPPEKYYDTSFIERTMKQHPEWFGDLPGES